MPRRSLSNTSFRMPVLALSNHSMPEKNINTIEMVNARAKEIKAIEESIATNNKKTMLFQRLPYYLRRRSRNNFKRKAKHSHRKKDRHFMRSHVFCAKRFFMLKIQHFSLPYGRRIKSSKFIFKSIDRGFFIEESFRGITSIGLEPNQTTKVSDLSGYLSTESANKIVQHLHKLKYKVIYDIENGIEIMVDENQIIMVGCQLNKPDIDLSCISLILANSSIEKLKLKNEIKLFKSTNKTCGLETHKIICNRNQVMATFQSLMAAGMIPVSLLEIERLALENQVMTIYDKADSELFNEIDQAIISQLIKKYERTPAGKKQAYDITKLKLSCKTNLKYCIFKINKGTCKRGAEIFANCLVIGRVVRAGYSYAKGIVCGLGYIYEENMAEMFNMEDKWVKDLDQQVKYKIEIVKSIEQAPTLLNEYN